MARSTASNPRLLTKEQFAAGQQCPKRLYLEYHHPEKVPELPPDRRALAQVGSDVVELARRAFPQGIRVEEEDPAAETADHLETEGQVVLFDAVFEWDGISVTCDIVIKGTDDTLEVFEVKSGTRVKPRHVSDLGLQVFAMENAGYQVAHAVILHLNPQYRRGPGDDYALHELFKNVDVTDRVRQRLDRIAGMLPAMHQLLSDAGSLDHPTGTWCTSPFPCPFLDRCRRGEVRHPLRTLPELTPELERDLRAEGVVGLEEIDPSRPNLTLRQRRALRAVQEDDRIVEPWVDGEFEDLEFPRHCLTILYAPMVLPPYEGMRPWRFVPFAWADHEVGEDGEVRKTHFVAAEKGDPREAVIRSLHRQLDSGGSMLFYADHHERRLRAVLEDRPDVKHEIRGILHMPWVDLGGLVSAGVYHPDFAGSFSFESVVGALAPELGEPDLELATPEAAAAAWRKIATPRTRKTTREKLAAAIGAYALWRSAATHALYEQLELGSGDA